MPASITRLLTLFFCFTFFVAFAALAADDAKADLADYQQSKHTAGKWDKYVEEGITAYHEEDYETAWKSLYQAYGKGCRSPIILFQMALIAESQENYSQALDFYKEAKKGFGSANKEHRYASMVEENYARCLYVSGEEDAARDLLEKSAKKSKSFWLFKMLGTMAADKGDTLSATAYFERAVRLEGASREDLITVYSLLGKLFINKGEQDAALRYYAKVIELDPTNAEAQRFVSGLRKAYQKTLQGGTATQTTPQTTINQYGTDNSLKQQMDKIKKMIEDTQ